MIDGISGAADLTPRARVEGAGAAQIYGPPPRQPRDTFLSHTQTLSPAETQSHRGVFTAPDSLCRVSEKQA